MAKKPVKKRPVETFTHEGASRRNIPTAELESVMAREAVSSPVK